MKWSIWFLGFELLTIEQSDGLDALVEAFETVESDSVASIDFGFAGNDE